MDMAVRIGKEKYVSATKFISSFIKQRMKIFYFD